METVRRSLPVRLEDHELIDRGKQLADMHAQGLRIEADKKAAAEDLKDRAEAAKREAARLAHICRTGYEPRMVECHWHYDYEHGEKSLVRQDTGEVIEKTAIPADERQTRLLS